MVVCLRNTNLILNHGVRKVVKYTFWNLLQTKEEISTHATNELFNPSQAVTKPGVVSSAALSSNYITSYGAGVQPTASTAKQPQQQSISVELCIT